MGLTAFSSSKGQSGGMGAGNPIAGTWQWVYPAQVGGTIYTFMRFGADGSFFSSSINEGGPQNGLRTELWGQYSIKPAASGQYLVTTFYSGKAPVNLCMQGMGCRNMGGVPTQPDRGIYQFQGNMMQSNTGISAQRSQIPPVLLQRLPATWMLQPPPPIHLSAGGGSGGRYVSPKVKTPGIMGNCDDLQQSRVCTTGSGWYHKDPSTGCMVCDQNSGVRQ